jgi:signal transduction histidine kinase
MVPIPTSQTADEPPRRRRSWLAGLSLKRVGIAMALALVAATALNPIFVTAFPIVLGRVMVIAMLLLLAFTLAGNLQPGWQARWLPRWLAQVLAVVLVAPLATLVVYLPSTGGSLTAILRHEGLVWGVLGVTATALLIAPVFALGALYRERDAEARNAQLRFELEKSTLERQALDSRLRLLHAQIEPHFLFNTLANVQALIESGSPQAAPVLKSLIDYLRAAMPSLNAADATLSAEVKLVRAYLELMQMRMPDRFRFAIDVAPEVGRLRFPPMALLTLVENAIRHGIDPSEQGGSVEVGAGRDAASGEVRVWVADSGAGMSEQALPGTGLTNLRARLTAFFGPAARLDLLEQQPRGLRAEIVFVADPEPAR